VKKLFIATLRYPQTYGEGGPDKYGYGLVWAEDAQKAMAKAKKEWEEPYLYYCKVDDISEALE